MLTIIAGDLMVAHPLQPIGFTFTLSSRLGQMLQKAEELYGERDKSFTILGIEFKEGVPQIWFPGNCGNVIIQLGLRAMQDVNQALFQLAHECVHLLNPHAGNGNMLEEGLAVLFSVEFMRDSINIPFFP